jgi:hypothetical protein
MSMQGRVENGTIVLDDPVPLPEGARVTIELIDAPNGSPDTASVATLYERLNDVVGVAGNDLPEDLAAQHDHYAHGTPKR